jgi:hypothetical protein
MMHSNRAYAYARKTFTPADIASLLGATQSTGYPRILASKPKRGIFATLRDLCLVAISWTFFIGLIVYPVAHLVGLAACAIALVVLPAERR